MVKSIRIFNGKQYGLRYKEKNKTDATTTANKLRKDGTNARVVKSSDGWYYIYGRKAKSKAKL